MFSPALETLVFLATCVSLAVSSSLHAPLRTIRRATVCNGSPDLCGRAYSNVTFIGTHNSLSTEKSLVSTQDYNITQQLEDGIRMLQLQVHDYQGNLTFCDNACSGTNASLISTYLGTVKSWMAENPQEVLTILIMNYDNATVDRYRDAYNASGLESISYAPPAASMSIDQWPTLGELIDSGKRLVTFMNTAANFNVTPYIIDEFANMWETAEHVTTTFDCNVNYTTGNPGNQLYLLNHYIQNLVYNEFLPVPTLAPTVNALSGQDSLGFQISQCVMWGRYPNFILVDFYEDGKGSVFQEAAMANGITYNPTTPIATPISGTAHSGPSPLLGKGRWWMPYLMMVMYLANVLASV